LARVTVIGIGYLGLTHAVCLADLGHEVLAIDVDEEKIAKASRGEVPFFEPGLEPLLRKNLDAGRLRFTLSFAEIAAFGDAHYRVDKIVADDRTAAAVRALQGAERVDELAQMLGAVGEAGTQSAAEILQAAEKEKNVG